MTEIGKGKADAYKDYRKVLERDDIDVVSVVTPDHWHVKIAIEALMAGKHVFCQKPLTLTLEENQLIRNACKKYWTRSSSSARSSEAIAASSSARSTWSRRACWATSRRSPWASTAARPCDAIPVVDPPAELDWEMWLGQAPLVDYRENGNNRRSHYEFRWWYEYSGGKFTDWGAHHVDIATWAIDARQGRHGPDPVDGTDAKHPVPYKDGYPTLDDRYNTSHDFAMICKFASGIEMVVDSRSDNGILFEGTKGRMFVNRGKITGTPIDENWDEGKYTEEDLVRLYKGKPARRAQGQLLSLHPRGRPAGLRRLHPRADDELLPSLRHRRPARPHDQVGPEGREDRWRRAGRRDCWPGRHAPDTRSRRCRRTSSTGADLAQLPSISHDRRTEGPTTARRRSPRKMQIGPNQLRGRHEYL